MLLYNEVSVLRLLDVAKEYALTDSNKESVRLLGDQILQTKNARFLLGLLLLAVGALAYARASSGLVEYFYYPYSCGLEAEDSKSDPDPDIDFIARARGIQKQMNDMYEVGYEFVTVALNHMIYRKIKKHKKD